MTTADDSASRLRALEDERRQTEQFAAALKASCPVAGPWICLGGSIDYSSLKLRPNGKLSGGPMTANQYVPLRGLRLSSAVLTQRAVEILELRLDGGETPQVRFTDGEWWKAREDSARRKGAA